MKNQSGFTLIELVVVIVILGILSAVAVPKFIDLRTDARGAAVKGIAGGLASASAISYAAEVTGKTSAVSTVGGCSNTVAASLTNGYSSTDYTISADSGDTSAFANLGDTKTCIVTDNDTTAGTFTASFEIIYVP